MADLTSNEKILSSKTNIKTALAYKGASPSEVFSSYSNNVMNIRINGDDWFNDAPVVSELRALFILWATDKGYVNTNKGYIAVFKGFELLVGLGNTCASHYILDPVAGDYSGTVDLAGYGYTLIDTEDMSADYHVLFIYEETTTLHEFSGNMIAYFEGGVVTEKDEWLGPKTAEYLYGFNTNKIELTQKFHYMYNLKSLSLRIENLISLSVSSNYVLGDCVSLTHLGNFTFLNTANGNLSRLKSLRNIGVLNISSSVNSSYLFNGCGNLKSIGGITVNSVSNYHCGGILANCYKLNSVPLKDISKGNSLVELFSGCSSVSFFPKFTYPTTIITASFLFYKCVNFSDTSNYPLHNVSDSHYSLHTTGIQRLNSGFEVCTLANSLAASCLKLTTIEALGPNDIFNPLETELVGAHYIESGSTVILPVTAGTFKAIWTNPDGRYWTFPVGAVLTSDSVTPCETSDAMSVSVTIPTSGHVSLHSADWEGNFSFSAYDLDTLVIDIANLPQVTHFLVLADCDNITGSLADAPPVDSYFYLTGNINVTGALTFSYEGFHADKIYLRGCTGIDVANTIINAAAYWSNKTPTTGACILMSDLTTTTDVTAEVATLVSAGFTIAYIQG